MKHAIIVAAIDLDDDLADAVVLAGLGLARKDNARLHVVSAWPPLATAAGYVADIAPVAAAPLTEEAIAADREARAGHEKRLKNRVGALAPDAIIRALDGEPAHAIAAYAQEVDADLIVTGSHQRGFWARLFQGASSRELIREAPCGVLLVTRPYAEKVMKARI